MELIYVLLLPSMATCLNLLSNHSFELPMIPNYSWSTDTATGWSGHNFDLLHYGNGIGFGQYIDMQRGPRQNAYIQQNISLTNQSWCVLSFYQAALDTKYYSYIMEVSWNGVLVATQTANSTSVTFHQFTVCGLVGVNNVKFTEIGDDADYTGMTFDQVSLVCENITICQPVATPVDNNTTNLTAGINSTTSINGSINATSVNSTTALNTTNSSLYVNSTNSTNATLNISALNGTSNISASINTTMTNSSINNTNQTSLINTTSSSINTTNTTINITNNITNISSINSTITTNTTTNASNLNLSIFYTSPSQPTPAPPLSFHNQSSQIPQDPFLLDPATATTVAIVSALPLNHFPMLRYLFVFAEDLWLYHYDQEKYQGNLELAFSASTQIQMLKFEVISRFVDLEKWRSRVFVSDYKPFTRDKYVEIEKSSTVILDTMFSFFLFIVPQNVLSCAVLYLLFRVLSAHKVSRHLRKYYFIRTTIAQTLLEGNVAYFAYVAFGNLSLLFSFNSVDRISAAFTVVFLWLVVMFTLTFYPLNGQYLKKQAGYFLYCVYRFNPGYCFLHFKILVRSFVRGTAFYFMNQNYELQLLLLGMTELMVILCTLYLQQKSGVFTCKLFYFFILIYHFLFLLFNLTLYLGHICNTIPTYVPLKQLTLQIQSLNLYLLILQTILTMVLDLIPVSAFKKQKKPLTKMAVPKTTKFVEKVKGRGNQNQEFREDRSRGNGDHGDHGDHKERERERIVVSDVVWKQEELKTENLETQIGRISTNYSQFQHPKMRRNLLKRQKTDTSRLKLRLKLKQNYRQSFLPISYAIQRDKQQENENKQHKQIIVETVEDVMNVEQDGQDGQDVGKEGERGNFFIDDFYCCDEEVEKEKGEDVVEKMEVVEEKMEVNVEQNGE